MVAHARRSETWRSLARAGAPDESIGDAEAAELMVALARAAAARA